MRTLFSFLASCQMLHNSPIAAIDLCNVLYMTALFNFYFMLRIIWLTLGLEFWTTIYSIAKKIVMVISRPVYKSYSPE